MPLLLLHRTRSARVKRDGLKQYTAPPPTETWTPIPHDEYATSVEMKLDEMGATIVGEDHAVSHEGKRYFGVYRLDRDDAPDGIEAIVGLRNSNDKVYPAGLVAGYHVKVTDSYIFTGEIVMFRKHTKNLMVDLPIRMDAAMKELDQLWKGQFLRVSRREGVVADHWLWHLLILGCVSRGILDIQSIEKALSWATKIETNFEAFTRAMTSLIETSGVTLPTFVSRTQQLEAYVESCIGKSVMEISERVEYIKD